MAETKHNWPELIEEIHKGGIPYYLLAERCERVPSVIDRIRKGTVPDHPTGERILAVVAELRTKAPDITRNRVTLWGGAEV